MRLTCMFFCMLGALTLSNIYYICTRLVSKSFKQMKVLPRLLAGLCVLAAVACAKTQPQETASNPTVKSVLNITPGFIGKVSGISEGQSFKKGDSFVLKLSAGEMLSEGFTAVHMEHIHIHVGDKVYQPALPQGFTSAQVLSIQVPVPEEDFDVVVAYAVQQQLSQTGYTMTLEDNKDGVKLYGVSPDLKYKYFDCYLVTKDAYTVTKVEFKMGDGQWQDANAVEGCGFYRTDALDWVYKVTVRPDYADVTGPVTLRVTGEQHSRHKITWVNNDSKYIQKVVSEGVLSEAFPSEAIDGELVEVSFYTNEPYYLVNATSSLSSVALEVISRAYIRFRMPAQDITVTLNFNEKIPVAYTKSAHIASAEIYSDKDIYYGTPVSKGTPGEFVYLFVTAESGYKPVKTILENGDSFGFNLYGDGLDRYTYFSAVRIPDGATSLTIRAEAAKAYTASGESVHFDGGSAYIPGENVTFTVSVPSGKTVKSVSAKTSGGADVTLTWNSPYGSFKMPEADVTVTVTFADTSAGTTAHVSAIYDSDEFTVRSSTNYDWVFNADGFDVPVGTNIYLSVLNDYGEHFWVSVKIGESVSLYEAQEDEMSGEYAFGRSFTISADTVIKVDYSKI